MPGHARRDIVREGEIGTYHCFSRCVQQAFLCGEDGYTGKNYEHRRIWIKELLAYQASVFAIDVGNYTVLSNHQHLIARTRPDIAANWTDEEVAWRWKLAWPHWDGQRWLREPTDEEVEEVLADRARLPELRANLASLSWFLARWKEPIAKLANAEMQRKGHFYEQRFGSREIVDDAANLCCSVYNDLNQLLAGMATSLDQCTCSAIQDRILAWRRLEALESVDHFQSSAPEGYVLTPSDMDQLLEDCFLAPIGDQGPLLLWGAADKPSMQGPATVITVQETELPTDPAAAASPADPDPNPAEDEAAAAEVPPQPAAEPDARVEPSQPTGTAVKTTRRRKAGHPQPTRRIHERLQRFRRRRASDNLFLGMPRQQYLDLVQWTAQQCGAEAPQPPPDEWDTVLRKWGVDPTRWCQVVVQFGELFHRAVGHVEKLAEVAQRVGRQWIQGRRACGDAFL